jgi:Bacterial membrane protein YfhO
LVSIRARLRGSGPAIGGLVVLVLVLFSDVIFAGRVFYERDIHLERFSQVEGFVRSAAARAWPIWDNTIAFGQGLLANPDAQIAYPPTWLNLLLQPWDYYSAFVVGHCLLTAVGMFVLTRRLKASPIAAFAAAGIWTASGPLLSLVSVWHHFAGACWIPWVVLAAVRAVAAPGLSATLVWGGAQAIQIVAGSAEMAALAIAASGGLVGVGIRGRAFPGPAFLSLLGRSALAAVTAGSLSAVLWMPTLDVLLRSSRAGLPEAVRTTWSVPLLGLARTLFPVLYTDLPLAARWQEGLFDTVPPFLHSLYLGLPTLALVVASRKSPDRTLWRASALLGTGAVALALGPHAPFYGLAVRILPPLAIFRYPSKVMLLVAFAWALLVALGVDAARSETGGRGRGVSSLLGLGGALMAGLGAWLLVQPEALAPLLLPPPWAEPLAVASRPLASGLIRSGVAMVAAMALLVACRGTRREVGLVCVVMICLADLILAHRGLNLTTPRDLVAFRPPILEGMTNPDHGRLYVYEYFLTPGASRKYLGRDDAYVIPSRPLLALTPELKVLSQRLYPFPPVAARWGIEGSFDVDTRGLYPRDVSTLVALLRAVEGTPAHLRLLRLGAVRWVIALHDRGFENLDLELTLPSLFPEPVRRFAVPDPLPRSYVVGSARFADGSSALDLLLDPAFDFTREVVLSSAPVELPSRGFHGTSRILELVSDRVVIEADLKAPGYVVLVDAYDPGWKATLDGDPVPILRANLAFRAVRAAAGRHVVEFSYRPIWLLRGLGLSLATALGLSLIGLAVASRGGRRAGRTNHSPGGQPSAPAVGNGERTGGGPPASPP